MERRRWKVFLDTSALIAGIISTTGSAREVLRLCEAGVVEPMLSRQVLTEADRILSGKLPTLIFDFRYWVHQLSPVLIEDPSRKDIAHAARIINMKDVPILAAAMKAEADYLITWDIRHFHKQPVKRAVPFKIMTPGEFLEEFRRSLPNT